MDTSSTVDGGSGSKVLPGTVGAMKNVGSNTPSGSGAKKPAEGQVVKGDGADNG
ncbi:hypothetical protein ACLBWX_13145 [Methylobacterium sp. M6A4_1b]